MNTITKSTVLEADKLATLYAGKLREAGSVRGVTEPESENSASQPAPFAAPEAIASPAGESGGQNQDAPQWNIPA